jgi:hypothetical protein
VRRAFFKIRESTLAHEGLWWMRHGSSDTRAVAQRLAWALWWGVDLHLHPLPLRRHVRAVEKLGHPVTGGPLLRGHLPAKGVEVHGHAVDRLHLVRRRRLSLRRGPRNVNVNSDRCSAPLHALLDGRDPLPKKNRCKFCKCYR